MLLGPREYERLNKSALKILYKKRTMSNKLNKIITGSLDNQDL